MSIWYEVSDIEDLSLDGEDLDICFKSDYNGNHYVSVPVELIKKILASK